MFDPQIIFYKKKFSLWVMVLTLEKEREKRLNWVAFLVASKAMMTLLV